MALHGRLVVTSGMGDYALFHGGRWAIILSIFIASIPGFTGAVSGAAPRGSAIPCVSALLVAEVDNNRAWGLCIRFWHTINDLDTEQHSDLKEVTSLGAMAAGSLLGIPLPHWSFARCAELSNRSHYAAFSEAEVPTGVDQINRGLETITDLYATGHADPRERGDEGGRPAPFWPSYYAGWRDLTFTKLTLAVNQVLDAPHPISPK